MISVKSCMSEANLNSWSWSYDQSRSLVRFTVLTVDLDDIIDALEEELSEDALISFKPAFKFTNVEIEFDDPEGALLFYLRYKS